MFRHSDVFLVFLWNVLTANFSRKSSQHNTLVVPPVYRIIIFNRTRYTTHHYGIHHSGDGTTWCPHCRYVQCLVTSCAGTLNGITSFVERRVAQWNFQIHMHIYIHTQIIHYSVQLPRIICRNTTKRAYIKIRNELGSDTNFISVKTHS